MKFRLIAESAAHEVFRCSRKERIRAGRRDLFVSFKSATDYGNLLAAFVNTMNPLIVELIRNNICSKTLTGEWPKISLVYHEVPNTHL